jgi:hypothetical protein
VLEAGHPRLLLNCSRQAGKSTVVALLALAEAAFVPFTKVLLLSRCLRQSTELFRIVTGCYRRISPAFLAKERVALGESWYRQEYLCSFESLEGLVYPDFARCVAAGPAPAGGRRYGGIDFGFRNPFAALWGTLDRDDVLWLTGEHYARGRPLSHHAGCLPRDVGCWYADPSGANERCELRLAGFAVREGVNALRSGIAAVSARLESGTLRVVEGRCPNLLAEAGLYRYPRPGEEGHGEAPVDEYNHALAALRYLVASLDQGRLARRPPGSPPKAPRRADRWLRLDNEELWTRII